MTIATNQTIPGIVAAMERQLLVADIVRLTRAQCYALLAALAKTKAAAE